MISSLKNLYGDRNIIIICILHLAIIFIYQIVNQLHLLRYIHFKLINKSLEKGCFLKTGVIHPDIARRFLER